MKTKIFFILISIIAIAFTGCVEDEVYVGPPSFSSVTLDPSTPGATDDVTVTAVLSDLKGISSATLYYKVSTAESFTSAAMTAGAEKSYSAVVPAYPLGTIVLYYIEAENVSKLNAFYPADAPNTTSAYTVGAPAIVINEIFSRGVVSDPDWIELYNSSNSTVNIGGYKIYDSGGQTAAKPKMEIPSGATIASHGYYVIVVDDASVDNPDGSSFGLSSGGEEVWLESSAGYLIDNVIFPAMPVATTSYGRKPDGSATWEILTTVTKNAPNSATAPVITGTAINPTSPSASDAVTVSATVTDLQSLSTVKLYYKVDAGTYTNIIMTAVGNVYSAVIPAQVAASVISYYIEAVNNVPLTTYSPATAPTTPATYTVVSPSAITNFAKTPAIPYPGDIVTVSATIVDVQGLTSVKLYYKVGSGSYSSVTMTAAGNDYSGVIPAQAGAEVVSYYIEATNVPGLKVYAPTEAPTTPATYTVAGPILMNEIFARGSAGNLDWIEIYNGSNAPVDISGYKIGDSGAFGATPTKPKMEFAAGTIIPAHGFFVITVDDPAIDYPDLSSFGLSSSGEQVWLENATGTIIDNLTFGTTAVATESFGRRPDGSSNWQVLSTITKGATNGAK